MRPLPTQAEKLSSPTTFAKYIHLLLLPIFLHLFNPYAIDLDIVPHY